MHGETPNQYESAKQTALKLSQSHAGRVYVVQISGEFYTQTRDELERNGLSMLSPSPVVGFANSGKWIDIKNN